MEKNKLSDKELLKLVSDIIISFKFSDIDDLFEFGKYKGKSFNHVFSNDPDYIRWCWENIHQFTLSRKLIILFYEEKNIKLTANSKALSEDQLNREIMETIYHHEINTGSPTDHPKWDDDLDNDQQDPEVWDRF